MDVLLTHFSREVVVGARKDGLPLVHFLAKYARLHTPVSMLTSLLIAGCDINARLSESGKTALHIACAAGNTHGVKLLVSGGGTSLDRNAQDASGTTHAGCVRKFDMFNFLEQLGKAGGDRFSF